MKQQSLLSQALKLTQNMKLYLFSKKDGSVIYWHLSFV